ncbi:putative late blight resistance protein homolog R1B-16 [Salvia hispanica]|uniref:putative late blight resistance protein homolog R1B-16 n=1 Tax=Salvia hispanica TaxID=49212 RepID=UPI0020091646|nr:putative late blight resistance protein homolog R1B-16 [Salvia hispanica]
MAASYKETIREEANTAEEIIQYLFSPQYLSDLGSIDPSVRLLDQLGELAEELDSTVGYVVDNIRQQSDFPAVSSSSRSALESEVVDPVVATDLIVINSNRLRRLAEKIMSTGRELADEDPSDPPSITTKDAAIGFADDLSDSTAATSSSRPASTTKYFVADFAKDPSKDDLVRFDYDMAQMMERVINYSYSNLQILPIVGMGGIGKSTLTRQIYDDPLVKDRYDIRAWVTVSQNYSVESILSQLLASIKGKVDRVGRDSLKGIQAEEEDIYKTLSGGGIIVMDDIWSAEAWDRVQCLFPDNNNSRQIILTTRKMDVASAISYDNIYMMPFLDDYQSWYLFQQKVFGDQDCPLELQSVGKKIVEGCGGLPLSIVTVAGLLSTIPRTPKSWQQFERNDWQLGSILSLTYNHLTPHLRKCFLYMAAFPQDYDIHASELIKLWVAEGFMECRNESESVEMVAGECLEDLIKQTLVLITCRTSDGKIKSCKLHSMVWDFCVRQAGQEKFLLSIKDYFPNLILRRDDRSYWELGQVFELINLTYLASSIPDSIVPPAIAKLQNLQTLIIYRSDVCLPLEIWNLRQLRHLIAFSFRPLLLPEGATLFLENLQTLSLPTNFVCSERMVKMIPNIKKLGIWYSEEKFSAGYYLDDLARFLRLEKLKLEAHGSFVRHFDILGFPQSLIKLELNGGWSSWNDMTIVGSLSNLKVLKPKNYACYGDQWEFGRLILLLIDESNLKCWRTSSSHFPRLKCLMLHRCAYLDEIPNDIGNIKALELIEIDDHNQSLRYSAQKIQEEYWENYGFGDLKVVVKRS